MRGCPRFGGQSCESRIDAWFAYLAIVSLVSLQATKCRRRRRIPDAGRSHECGRFSLAFRKGALRGVTLRTRGALEPKFLLGTETYRLTFSVLVTFVYTASRNKALWSAATVIFLRRYYVLFYFFFCLRLGRLVTIQGDVGLWLQINIRRSEKRSSIICTHFGECDG